MKVNRKQIIHIWIRETKIDRDVTVLSMRSIASESIASSKKSSKHSRRSSSGSRSLMKHQILQEKLEMAEFHTEVQFMEMMQAT